MEDKESTPTPKLLQTRGPQSPGSRSPSYFSGSPTRPHPAGHDCKHNTRTGTQKAHQASPEMGHTQ